MTNCVYCMDSRKPESIAELLRNYKTQRLPVDHAVLHLMELFAAQEEKERVELEAYRMLAKTADDVAKAFSAFLKDTQ